MDRHYFTKRLLTISILLASAFYIMALANPHQITPTSLSKANPIYVITLPSNATTGYRWIIKSYNTNLLQLIQHQYIAPTSQLIGAGGQEIFQFKALPAAFDKVQRLTVVLIYKRPWEKTVSQTKVFVIVTK